MSSTATAVRVDIPKQDVITLVGPKNPVDESIAAFQKSLDKISKHGKSSSEKTKPSVTASCLVTLCKVLDNIILEKKYNAKTRSIKLGNKLFRERVGNIPGGVEFLLSCKFKYVRVPSKSPAKTQPNGSIPGNAIKLLKSDENRGILVAARKYLHEYGEKVMKLKTGKYRNELPPFTIRDNIPIDTMQKIQKSVESVVNRNVDRIENMESVLQQKSRSSNSLSVSSVMTPVGSFCLDQSGSSVCTTQELSGDDESLSSSNEKNSIVSARNSEDEDCSKSMTKVDSKSSVLEACVEAEETPTKVEPDLKIPIEISPLISRNPTDVETQIDIPFVVSPIIDKTYSPDSVADCEEKKEETALHLSSDVSLSSRLERLNVKSDGRRLDLEELEGDDNSLGSLDGDKRRFLSLSDEEIDSLEHITNCDNCIGTEDEQVLSIVTGIPVQASGASSKAGALFRGLNKLTFKKKEIKEDNSDQKTIVTSTSHIRIKHSDGLSLGSNLRPTNQTRPENQRSLVSEKNGKLLAESTASKLNNDIYAIDVGLKLFFAIFVVTYNFGDDFFNDDQLLGKAYNSDIKGPAVPIEIVYKLWTTLLRSERSFNKIEGREIYQTFLDLAKYREGETKDKSEFDSLEWHDVGICKYISQSMNESGLVNVSRLSLEMHHSTLGGMNKKKVLAMGITHEESKVCGLKMAGEFLKIQYERPDNSICLDQFSNHALAVERLRTKCHSIIARSLLENIDLESKDTIFIDRNVDFDVLSTWYVIRWLPHHLISAHMNDEAFSLLIDKRYLQARFDSNGLHLGTVQYVSECRIIRSIPEQGDNQSAQVSISGDDYGLRAVRAIYNAVHSYLNETKKGISLQVTKRHSKSLCDMANALQSLATAIGELEGKRKIEIDILVEALRFKVAGGAEKTSIADTQLQLASCYHAIGEPTKAIASYGDALHLNIELYGDMHGGLAKILYHMGVLYCEQHQYGPALECFVKALSVTQSQNSQEFMNLQEDVAKIYSWIGNVHREKGNYAVALQYFEKALHATETSVGKEHLDVAEILQNIGVVYDDLGNDDQSLRALYECLQIRRKLLNVEFHDSVVETICCIANVYRKTNVDKALRLFRIVLNARAEIPDTVPNESVLLQCYEDMLAVAKIKLAANGDDDLHVEIATLYFRMGSLLEKMGRYTECIGGYLKSLKIRKVKKHYHEIGDLLNSLGIAHAKRKSYKKAMKCFSDSLKVRKTVVGPHHEDVGETLHNMGNCAAKQSDFDKALECYEKALIIKRLTFGNNSLSTANTLQKIGMVNEELGMLTDSLNYYKDALAVRNVLLGKRHIDIAFSLHSIGNIYYKTNEYGKSIECLETSLRLKRKHYVGGHLNLSTADTMNLLAKSYVFVGKSKNAIRLFKETLFIFEKTFGAHMTTANVLDSLGSLNLSIGNLESAHSYLERALALKRLIYGDDATELSETLFYIGKVQSKSGDLDDALETFKEVLRIRKRAFGDGSTEVAAIINDVGVIQLRRGHNDVARNCFLEAQRMWKLQGDENQEYLGETLVNLGEIHHLDEEYRDAIASFKEALVIFESLHDEASLSVALVQFKLGKSQKELHDFDNAMISFEKALSIRSKSLSDDDMRIAEVLKDIGALCLSTGDLLKARDCLGDALRIMKAASPSGLSTAETFYHMGKVMTRMKYRDEAFEAFSNALRIKRRKLEKDDLDVADMLTEMAQIHEDRKQWQTSLDLYGQALQVREKLLGDHELVADCYFFIGAVRQTIRKPHKALESYGSALVVYQKVLGDDHLTCAKTMNNIGILYEGIEQLDEALKYHREALRIRQHHLGKDHIKIANSLDNIAGIYQRKQENDKALQSLKESLKIRSRFGNDNLDVATTLFGMGIIYCEKGDSKKALECYESALEIRKRRGKEFEVAQTLHNIGSLWAMRQDYQKALKQWQSALQIYRRTLDDDHHMVACTLGNIKMAENMINEENQF